MDKAIITLAALLWGGAATAQAFAPAEQPPADFTAYQYIDSTGCVFTRKDQDWTARVARDGTQLCGYPPSLTARRYLSDQNAASESDAVPAQTRAQQIEHALTDAIVTQLRPGELVSDTRPQTQLPDLGPEPADAGPALQLRAEIAAEPLIRQEMGRGLRPNQDLCHLLGYNGKAETGETGGGDRAQGLGQDPTQGFCDQLPRSDLARLAFTRPVPAINPSTSGQDQDEKGSTPSASDPDAQTDKPEQARLGDPLAHPTAKPKRTSPPIGTGPAQIAAPANAATNAATSAVPPKSGTVLSLTEYIPAGARYVQIGAFARPENAERAAAKLQKTGLPIMRQTNQSSKGGLVILMAGPFPGRQQVVMALDQIRRAGFRDSYAR